MNLPRYKCHKEVGAVKIIDLIPVPPAPCAFMYGVSACGYKPNDCMHIGSSLPTVPPSGRHHYVDGAGKTPDLPPAAIIACYIKHDIEGLDQIPLTNEYMDRCRPKIGGYFVVYEDSYESFSPASAFEEGYALIDPPHEERHA